MMHTRTFLVGTLVLSLLATGGATRSLATEVGNKATAQPATADRIVAVPVLELQLHGVGELRFGERFQWRLRSGLPVPLPSGDGGVIGDVTLESVEQTATDYLRQQLPEPSASGMLEIGASCSVLRAGAYAIIRCLRDYLFDTASGKPAIAIWPQFPDRGNPSPEWLAGMPLPWWRPSGSAISLGSGGKSADAAPAPAFLFLDYGWVNYGNAVESTEIRQGPALLDLATGRIARARVGASAAGPVYDASAAAEDEPVALYPSAVTSDTLVNGHRVITVSTVFDRCVAATCRSDDDPQYQRVEPLTYVFD